MTILVRSKAGFPMGIVRTDSAEGTCFRIDKSARIEDSEEITRELCKLLESGSGTVTLDLEGLSRLDVTFLQILLAASASFACRERRLVILTLPLDHVLVQMAGLCGIDLKSLTGTMQ
jgi:anti-anti-sigma regulatory factor